jgi:two-component system, cell cycle sensor histidine kinase and response regulator CckA
MMKTILVLDDEVTFQAPMCRLLQSHGYRTLEAGDEEEAIRQFQDNGRKIDLLIADVGLPIGSGVQVALTLREHLPELKVILASGYPSEMWKARDFALLGKIGPDSVSILQKPMGAQALLGTIGSLIGEGQPEAARTA